MIPPAPRIFLQEEMDARGWTIDYIALHTELDKKTVKEFLRGDRKVSEEIAIELGSAREVISRHLKLMEKAGLVALGRSSLRVRDPVGLMRLRDGPR